ARAVRVRVLLAKRDFVTARVEVEALQREFPNSPAVLDLRAAVHMADRDATSARASYLRAVERSPDDLEALAGLVNLGLSAGRSREAVGRVDEVLKRGAPSPALLTLAARTYSAVGDVAKAEGFLTQAITADPKR